LTLGFGPGKVQLLEAIATCGSISAAGRAIGMSYKWAWDLVNEINHICGCKAVARRIGSKNGGGMVLTPFGASLVALSENRAHCGTRRPAGSPEAAIRHRTCKEVESRARSRFYCASLY
jgi:molybdate transport repressor ModE-like protein